MTINRRRAEIDFHLFDVLNVGGYADWPAFTGQDVTAWTDVISTAEHLAGHFFAPHNHEGDQNEPRIEDGHVRIIDAVQPAIRAFCEAGFMSAHRPASEDGLGLPWTVVQGAFALFQAANISTFAYPFLTIAASNMLSAFGSEAQKARFLPHLLSGRFFATMALSEPQAGSGLADIRTRARPLNDGTYALTGTKQWISGGAHELADTIVHFVLARIEGAPAGVKGISLFIAPRDWVEEDGKLGAFNNVELVSLLHKMGYRGTTSTILNFGEAGTCRGFLIGEAHHGLNYMFKMMNEARIGVGLGASMLALAGFHYSLDYCATRRQGRAIGDKRPDLPPIPIDQHPDVKHMLLAQKAYAEGSLGLCLYCANLIDQRQHPDPAQQSKSDILLEILTPVAKAWPSAYGPKANDLAIQCLGGYGYTRDYPVEQLYRDNRLNPIHEGTNGIQALDLLGRKLTRDGGEGYRRLRQIIDLDLMAQKNDKEARTVRAAWQRIDKAVDVAIAKTEAGHAPELLANASAFLEAFGHATIAWRLLVQAQAAERTATAGRGDKGGARGRRQALKWFTVMELPRVEPLLDLVDRCEAVAAETQAAWL
jgi:alkylation response protein AidB-like acyl-CoA dehydrogenase